MANGRCWLHLPRVGSALGLCLLLTIALMVAAVYHAAASNAGGAHVNAAAAPRRCLPTGSGHNSLLGRVGLLVRRGCAVRQREGCRPRRGQRH